MFCPYCGKENREGARFCDGCGKSLAPGEPDAAQKQEGASGTGKIVESAPILGVEDSLRRGAEPAENDNPAPPPKEIVSKKKSNRGLVVVVVALALLLVTALVFIIARSQSPEKEYQKLLNWRGGDWTNRDDILPHKNEEGYIVFGAYEQDGDESNGPEPIEWEILEENGNGIFLVSRYVLDVQQYNMEYAVVTWESCTLRSWLNDEFLNKAFTEREQEQIRITEVTNSDHPVYGTPGGNSTRDRIFLLSADEVISYYSFNSWYDESQLGYCQQLIIPPTAYAEQQGVSGIVIDEDYYNGRDGGRGLAFENYSRDCIGRGGARWWLRSPGCRSGRACLVEYYGLAVWDQNRVDRDMVGLRPALYIEQ